MAKKFVLFERTSSEQFAFSWKVFVGWDFAVTSSRLATGKRRQITVGFKETLVEDQRSQEHIKWVSNHISSFCHCPYSVKYWVIRAITNTIILLLLGVSTYAIYVSVVNAENNGFARNRDITASLARGWEGIVDLILSFQVCCPSHHLIIIILLVLLFLIH